MLSVNILLFGLFPFFQLFPMVQRELLRWGQAIKKSLRMTTGRSHEVHTQRDIPVEVSGAKYSFIQGTRLMVLT